MDSTAASAAGPSRAAARLPSALRGLPAPGAWDAGRVFGDLLLSEVRPRIWYQLRDYLVGRDLKPKTAKNVLGSLRALVRDAMDRTDYIQGNPFAQLKWQRSLPAEPDPFDERERDSIVTWFKIHKLHYHPVRAHPALHRHAAV